MASGHETTPYVGPQVSAGRQALDAVCVAVLVVLLTWAASAIAHVPGPAVAPAGGHAGHGKAADDCETAKPVAQTASAENPLGGMAAVAECEDGKAPAAPAHGAPAAPTPQH
jgi:hypothetical protein